MDTYIPLLSAFLAGLFSAVAAITVAVIQSRAQHNKSMAELDKRDALQAQRLAELEKKMDKHNNLIDRMYRVEERVKVLEEHVEIFEKK